MLSKKKKKIILCTIVTMVIGGLLTSFVISVSMGDASQQGKTNFSKKAEEKDKMKLERKLTIKLPEIRTSGGMSVEEAISRRRSVREFRDEGIEIADLGQILWAVQGCTGEGCLRATPSAGATYPLEIFAVAGQGGVKGLDAGIYHYLNEEHELSLLKKGDFRKKLAEASLGQECIILAPVSIIFAADYSRTMKRYGERGRRYVNIEIGHAGENLYLQAQSLGLGTVAVGAFDDKKVAGVLDIPQPLEVLYIMPVGKRMF